MKRAIGILCIVLTLSVCFGAIGALADEPIELRWLSSQIGEEAEAKWFSQVVSDFNALHEGKIRINVDGVAGDACFDKLRTDAASGTMPDLFMLNADAARFNLIAGSGRVADLKPLFDADTELAARIDADSAATYTDAEGHILGLPYAKSYVGIFYNKALFEAAGVSAFPATWDEFFDACDKIKATGVAPLALMTGENSWTTMLLLSDIIGSTPEGLEWLKYKPDTVQFNEPVFVDAAAKLQRMLAEYTTLDAVGATYAVAANNFLNGKAAMIANGPWMIGDFANTAIALPGLEQNVACAIAPGGSTIQSENIAYAVGSSDPAKLEAAYEVIKYLATPEVYAGFLNVSGNSPAIEIDKTLLTLDPINAEYLPQAMEASNRHDMLSNCVKPAVNDGLGQLLPDLATGALTPEQFAEQLQQISDKN